MVSPAEFLPGAAGGWHTALSVAAGLALLGIAWRTPATAPRRDGRWIFALGLFLLAGRWPIVRFPFALNPDESQFIAGAHTLTRDPVFWRSVNGMTSGPLNYLALWPAGSLLGYGTYLGARLTAVVLLAVTLGALHLLLASRFGARAARLGGLPTGCFLALTAHPDFTHYSLELLSMALLATAAAVAGLGWASGRRHGWRDCLVGLLLGAIPLAKPQVGPLALVLGVGLVLASRGRRGGFPGQPAALIAGAFAPAALCALVLASQGVLGYACRAYFEQNVAYVHTSAVNRFRTAFQLLARPDPPSPMFLAWAGTGLLGLLLLAAWWPRQARRDRAWLGAGAAGVGLAGLCVITPGRPFPHYLMLMPAPWLFLYTSAAGGLLGTAAAGKLVHVATHALLAGTVAVLLAVRAGMPYPPRLEATPYGSDFSGEVSALLRAHSRPGDTLGMWGWRDDLFVLANLPQATRDGVTESAILEGPYRPESQQIYLRDFRRSRPALFVDGVGPGAFAFQSRATQSPAAVFPALARVLAEDYVLLADLDGARVYARRERLAAGPGRAPAGALAGNR